MFSIKKCLLFILLPLITLGCGGENSDIDKQSPEENISINSQDSLLFSPTENTQIIDLRQKIIAENNQELVIEKIQNIDNNCSFDDINGLTFRVTTYDTDVCRFKYYVKPKSLKYKGTSEAIVQVVVTNDYVKRDFLPPVSRTIIEAGSLTLNNKDLLIESGFKIDPTSIYLTGETTSSNIGEAAANESSITYQAPENMTGAVRIFYTEIDPINNIARPGVVYIAIGKKDNNNPIALDKTLQETNLTKDSYKINISEYISDQDDGDLLQLIDIKSFLGSIKIDSGHSFIYKPQSIGIEVLTYIISDHNGGYGIGTLSFFVNPYESIIDDKQELLFTPPLTMEQLSQTQEIFTDQFQETSVTGYTGIYPTFDQKLAEAYCRTIGMNLPTQSELEKMQINVLHNEPIFLTKYHWHSGKKYLTTDNRAISLDDGAVESITDGYFSCIESLKPQLWSFLTPYYSAKYDIPTSIYLSAKKDSGESIFLDEEEYNLEYKVDSMNVNGILTDPKRADEFITIEINANEITISKVDNGTDFAVNVTLVISDPIAKDSTTKLILGVTTCPYSVTPPIADQLGCILILHGKKNEIFTGSLSNNMLTTMGVDITDINKLGDLSIGKGDTFFKGIQWSNPKITDEDRNYWLGTLDNVCQAMNDLKIEGRTNWMSGSTTVDPLKRFQLERTEFFLNDKESVAAITYVRWLHDIDNGALGNYHNYGLGYAQSDPTSLLYVNQYRDYSEFVVQTNKRDTHETTATFPSCWSKN